MKVIVLDTNIIFSILLDRGSKIREKFFEKDVRYIAPNFVFVELFKHKEKLLKFSRLSEAELLELLHRILHRITFVDESTIATATGTKLLNFARVSTKVIRHSSLWPWNFRLNCGRVIRNWFLD